MEAHLKSILESLVDGRIYPDVSPDCPEFPLIVYQQIGGQAYIYLDQTLPDHRHSRMQVYVWAQTRGEANVLAREVEKRIVEHIMNSSPVGAFTSIYNDTLKLYGTRQDFSIWYKY